MSRIKDQMDKFMKGFCDLVPHSLITIFDENELEVCIHVFDIYMCSVYFFWINQENMSIKSMTLVIRLTGNSIFKCLNV